jgi:solute carrier family 25 (mitochondrial phosphate transporter), member 3
MAKQKPSTKVFSPEYYALRAGGGMLSAGTTHLAITPLDVLKVNMQVRFQFYDPFCLYFG